MSEQTNSIELMSSDQLVRWAQRERSTLIARYLESAATYVAASFRDSARYLGKITFRVVHELYLRNAARTLQQFDDHLLTDIGLRRAEIEYVVRNGRTHTRVGKPMRSQQRRAA